MARVFDGFAGSDRAGEPITLTTEDRAFICPPGGGKQELYDLAADPGQQHDLSGERPDESRSLHAQLLGFLESIGTPSQRVDAYRPGQSPSGSLLAASTPLFTLDDGRGQVLAFPTQAEALECVAAIPGGSVRQTTFGSLLDGDPQALVHVHEQYYYATDLA